MDTIFVGRQPIYNRQLDVVAYELLFRASAENKANVWVWTARRFATRT